MEKEGREKLRREFTANVSHELKTPLALIQGYAEGLKDGINDDAESREFYCEVIMDEAAARDCIKRLSEAIDYDSCLDVDYHLPFSHITHLRNLSAAHEQPHDLLQR